jgi:hypothetical protein
MSNIESGENAYTYRKSTKGFFVNQPTGTIDAALADEEWDVITIQQVSQNSGNPNTFTKLAPIVSYIKEKCPNAKIVWHMTWAYQQDTTHFGFANYQCEQKKMYDAILDAVKSCVLSTNEFSMLFPVGTAIQNARTSYLGDTLTRDGFHLTIPYGRYIAALTWGRVLTGKSVEGIAYAPEGVDEALKAIAIESVENAVKSPFEVTQSIFVK